MSGSNQKPSEMHRGTKFLLVSLASAATLSGWAWLTVTAPPPATDAEQADPTDAATVVPTEAPKNIVNVALVTTPVPSLTPMPKLKQLPVRGLRYVTDALPTAVVVAPPTGVPTSAPPQDQPPQQQSQGGGGGNQNRGNQNAGAPQQPPAPPPAAPPPPPKRKTKPSH